MQDAWALFEGIWCWPGWKRLLTLRLRSDDDYSCDLLSHLVDLEYQIYWSFYVREYPVGINRGGIVGGGRWAPIPVYGYGMCWAFVELKQSIVERTWAPSFVHGHDMGWEFVELRENIVEKETWTPAPVHGRGQLLSWEENLLNWELGLRQYQCIDLDLIQIGKPVNIVVI